MTITTDVDERELLLRLRDGDHDAFEVLYHRYKIPLASKLLAVLKVDELVEDALQELFYRIWERRESIDPEHAFAGYLYRIAANLANDHFRKLAMDARFRATNALQLRPEDQQAYSKELDEALYTIIDQLPDQRKRVFLLCKFEDKSYEEVAQLLQISTNAVKDHIVKANKFLKENYPKIAPLVTYYIALEVLSNVSSV